jgi:ribonuclease T2
LTRNYTITEILLEAGAHETLNYMSQYWLSDEGTNEAFWEHEWEKHGTCYSTLEPSCYSDYQYGEEAVEFFGRVVALFQNLTTYDWLAGKGITPSLTQNYSLAAVQEALEEQHQAPVTLKCINGTLSEVWYYFNVQGSVQSGTFVPAGPDGGPGDCPQEVQYPPKASMRKPTARLETVGSGVSMEQEDL